MVLAPGSIWPASAVAITTFAQTFAGHSRSAANGVLSFGDFTMTPVPIANELSALDVAARLSIIAWLQLT